MSSKYLAVLAGGALALFSLVGADVLSAQRSQCTPKGCRQVSGSAYCVYCASVPGSGAGACTGGCWGYCTTSGYCGPMLTILSPAGTVLAGRPEPSRSAGVGEQLVPATDSPQLAMLVRTAGATLVGIARNCAGWIIHRSYSQLETEVIRLATRRIAI